MTISALPVAVPARNSAAYFALLHDQAALYQVSSAKLNLVGLPQSTFTHSVPTRGSSEYFAVLRRQAEEAHGNSRLLPGSKSN